VGLFYALIFFTCSEVSHMGREVIEVRIQGTSPMFDLQSNAI
jgi:hypothetical protein